MRAWPAVLLLLLCGCGRSVLAPEKAQRILADVRAASEAKDWSRVRSKAKPLLRAHPLTQGSEEASFLAAVAEEALGRPTKAYRIYETLLREHPASSRVAEVSRREFDLAAARHAEGKRRLKGHFLAIGAPVHEVLERAASHDPFSEQAPYALFLAATSLYDQGRHDEAEPDLDRLLRDHPGSPWTPQAEFLRAMNSFRRYRGPTYDGVPLRDAQERFESFLRRRPESPDAESARRMLAVISDLWVRHDLAAARLYERLRQPGASRLYYEHAIERSPDSPWAEEAHHALGR